MKKLTAALSLVLGLAVIAIGFTADAGKTARNALAAVGLVIVIASGFELIWHLRRRSVASDEREEPREKPQYARKRMYISRAELIFLDTLKQIAPDKYEVIPQVALCTVIDKLTQNAYRNELFRVADYLFVDKDDYTPLLLVELNDASHSRADRQERDRKVREICESAGLPLVTFTTAESRDFGLVRKTVIKNILRR